MQQFLDLLQEWREMCSLKAQLQKARLPISQGDVEKPTSIIKTQPRQLQIKGGKGSIQLESQLEAERAQTKTLRIEFTKLTEALKDQEGAANTFQVLHDIQMTNWKTETNRMAAALKAAQDQLQAERMKEDKEALQNDADAMRLKTCAEIKWIAVAKTNRVGIGK